MLQKTVDEGKRVMIDIRDSYSVQTVVVRFEYIHDRWAMGKSICYYDGEEVEIPYTIHYSDIFCNKKMNVKVVVEGENPLCLEILRESRNSCGMVIGFRSTQRNPQAYSYEM
ncbi:hypothetical protein BCP12_113 [Bacillus phage BCP12]|uniref:Uncharacterized protein n=1 Tax=Bacillus phage BCP12 TaxID=1913122 RepID=A0A2S0CSQ0_9CAUD|nr:hypothetical protein BCP12_113 [Bacillus phage BCP12]